VRGRSRKRPRTDKFGGIWQWVHVSSQRELSPEVTAPHIMWHTGPVNFSQIIIR